jgi:hypothetical protein
MPVPTIILTASQRDDLATTCAVGKSALERIALKMDFETPTIKRRKVDDIIRNEIGDPDAAIVSRFLFGIAGPLRRDILTAEEMLKGISEAIEARFKNDDRFANWASCQPVLLQLLRSASISSAAKALDISYDFERVYASGRFLTSVRPVYNEKKDDIVGATIVQTLRLNYVSSNGDEASISIAIDLDDIKALKFACEEAINKAITARNRFEGQYGLDIIMPGGGMS